MSLTEWQLQVQQAVAALPGGQTAAQYQAILAAQTKTLTNQDTPVRALKTYLLTTGEWPNIVIRSKQTPTANAQTNAAITAAVWAVELANDLNNEDGVRVIQTSIPQIASTFSQYLNALVVVGDIQQSSAANIIGMQTVTISQFSPVPTVEDIHTITGAP